MGFYLCTWAAGFSSPAQSAESVWDVPNWYTILSFLPFTFPMPRLPVLNVHVNFPCISGGLLCEEYPPLLLSIIQSFAPTLHPPFLGEAGISSNDYYLFVYSSNYRTGFDLVGYFSSSFFFGAAGGLVSGFPPRFLKVAERVRVATADDRGRGRIPVGLGCATGI